MFSNFLIFLCYYVISGACDSLLANDNYWSWRLIAQTSCTITALMFSCVFNTGSIISSAKTVAGSAKDS